MPRARHTVGGQAGCCSDIARNGKRAQRHELKRVLVVLSNGPDHVRTVEASTATAKVVFAVVVELEGLPTLQTHGAVDPPTHSSVFACFRSSSESHSQRSR